MTDAYKGQVNKSAAEVYDEFFLPALFEQWPEKIIERAYIKLGDRVVDIACGTGVLACAVEEVVKPTGSVIGVDINDAMLKVAARKSSQIDWRLGAAEDLPVENQTCDAAVSQFGLMFFEDQVAAIQEMLRVTRPGGYIAVVVWDEIDNSPGYAVMVDLLQKLFGDSAADALRAPFKLGDVDRLAALFAEAGSKKVEITTYTGLARFPSIESWVHTDIRGWTLSEQIDDAQYQEFVKEAQREFQVFVGEQGEVSFPTPVHIAALVKV